MSLSAILRERVNNMTYRYRCELEHIVDVKQKISEEALTECQKCGSICKSIPFTGEDANGAFEVTGFSYKDGYGLRR